MRQMYWRFGGRHWFPHVPLAILLVFGAAWLLQAEIGRQWGQVMDQVLAGRRGLPPGALPPVLTGVGMLVMAFGLLFRSRLAWMMALLLSATAAAGMLLGPSTQGHLLFGYFVLMLAALAFAWRQFDRSSIAAGTLFALTSVILLVTYATFGTYYLGREFDPPVADVVTSFYFALVTMSTVGYGDITPQTSEAKLFVVSIVVLGVAAFATSLTAVIAPLVSRSLQRIVSRGDKRMKREDHFVIAGDTPLAVNTWRELARRGHRVTWLVRQEPAAGTANDVDLVVGDPSSNEILKLAGAGKAQAVVAMMADDSENAFLVLAVRGLGSRARTVATVNDARHLERVRLVQPDLIIAPQVLGGELAAMVLTGETVSAEFLMKRLLNPAGEDSAPPAPTN